MCPAHTPASPVRQRRDTQGHEPGIYAGAVYGPGGWPGAHAGFGHYNGYYSRLPGETQEDFEDTLRLVERVRFDAAFTFIYSKRSGTPAAKMPDPVTREEKQERFDRLLALQNAISGEKHAAYVGKVMKVLVDDVSEDERCDFRGRTNGGRLVHIKGEDAALGEFADVKITGSSTWALFGELV